MAENFRTLSGRRSSTILLALKINMPLVMQAGYPAHNKD